MSMEAWEPWGEEFMVVEQRAGLETDVPAEREEQEGKQGSLRDPVSTRVCISVNRALRLHTNINCSHQKRFVCRTNEALHNLCIVLTFSEDHSAPLRHDKRQEMKHGLSHAHGSVELC